MDREKFEKTVMALKAHRPFLPFTIALVDGDRHEIDHPDALAVRNGFVMFIGPETVPVWFDHGSVSQIIGDLATRASA